MIGDEFDEFSSGEKFKCGCLGRGDLVYSKAGE